MSVGLIVQILQGGIVQVLKCALPVLLVALVVGLIVAILQAVTSIQEQTLTFVPKILAIFAVLTLLGTFMFSSMKDYTIQLFNMIGNM